MPTLGRLYQVFMEQFGKWRSLFWPVHRFELRKFLPMLCICFLITFNYNALRSYKDTMVVTASNSGAEALPFIKVWAVLPAALLLTYVFTRLAFKYSREKVFYIMMGFFLSLFFLFAFVLYPNRETLHPHEWADRLQNILPTGFKGFIAIYRNWTFTLFYVLCELWSTAIMTVLFWGFANEVTTVEEAKRFYGLLATGGNVAGIFAGHAAICYSGNLFIPWLPYGNDAWDQSILFLNCTVILAGLITIALFRWLNQKVLGPSEKLLAHKPEKIKMSMRENFAYLSKSKYLICIALIVLSYNLAINLVEVVWKNQLKELYPNPSDYNTYMGQVMVAMGIIASLAGLFTTTNLIRRYSWTVCALIPLFIVATTSLGFFAFVLAQQWNVAFAIGGATPLFLSVTLGSIQNCLSRASKYTLFDATKEISFIPLNAESKLKGKAAIDGVGSRLGKSGGSVIHQSLLIFFSTVGASTPYVAAIFIGVMLVWGLAVVSLGKKFDILTGKKPTQDPLVSSNPSF